MHVVGTGTIHLFLCAEQNAYSSELQWARRTMASLVVPRQDHSSVSLAAIALYLDCLWPQYLVVTSRSTWQVATVEIERAQWTKRWPDGQVLCIIYRGL